jgi:hypothetical protein
LEFNGFPYEAAVAAVGELQASVPDDAELIGLWDWLYGLEGFVMLYRHDGKVVKKEAAASGGGRGEEVLEERGGAFWVPGSSTGDHCKVRLNGDLEFRDNDGLIFVANQMAVAE